MPLTDSAIRNAKPADSPYKLFDGGGLHLQITPTGSRLWRLKYRFDGREKLLSFGPYPVTTLKKARIKRDEAKAKLLDGIDPSQAKRAQRREAKVERANTFDTLSKEYVAKLEKEGRAAITLKKIRWLLEFTKGHFADRPISEIESPENRWRVVCPSSRPLPPGEHKKQLARLNGVLAGALGQESFDLSRSYYIGGVGDREPETFLVDGQHIDTRADLDAGAIYSRKSEAVETASEPGNWSLETLRDSLFFVPPDSEYETWWKCLAAVHHETGGSRKGLAIAEAWSASGEKWKEGEVRAKWRSFGGVGGPSAAAGTLFHHARENGWEGPTEDFDSDFDDLTDDDPDTEIARLLGLAEKPSQPAKAGWGAPMMRGDKPVNNLTNTTLYLGRNLDSILPGLALNLMSGREEWTGGEVDDATVSLARMGLEKRGLQTVGKEMVGDAINVVARKLQWHPIRDYLGALIWDGTERLDTWLVRHVGAEDSPYVRAVGRKFLMQMVARVMAPGCKVDHTLVLSGSQGLGKSTLCHVLAGDDYFSDSMPSVTKGDGIEASRHVAGKWLVELAELAPSRKSDAEDLKAFLSRSIDRVRIPWAKRDASFPRQCVFVGTTNDDTFLLDATGGRRFWPVAVTKRIDIAALTTERDQLFAEALSAYRAGEPWHLDPAFEAEHASPVQEAARVSDSWTEKVAAWLAMEETDDFEEGGDTKPRLEVSLLDVLENALGLGPTQLSMANQKRAAAVMRDLNWTKHRTRTGIVWRCPRWAEPRL